jgi:hypothetical protein
LVSFIGLIYWSHLLVSFIGLIYWSHLLVSFIGLIIYTNIFNIVKMAIYVDCHKCCQKDVDWDLLI